MTTTAAIAVLLLAAVAVLATATCPGTFTAPQFAATTDSAVLAGRSIAVYDVDSDGVGDIVAGYVDPPGPPTGSGVGWFRATGTASSAGDFAAYVSISTYGSTPYAIVFGDVSGDATPGDIIISWTTSITYQANNGAGVFSAEVPIATGLTSTQVSFLVLADADADGDVDLFAARDTADNQFFWWLSDGAGAFSQFAGGVAAQTHTLAVGDVSGDGHVDVVVTQQAGNAVTMHLGDGTGAFAGPLPLTDGLGVFGGPSGIVLTDADADTDIDILLALKTSSSVVYLESLGGLVFAPRVAITTQATSANRLLLADWNGDGASDFVVLGGSDGPMVGVNMGNGVFSTTLLADHASLIPTALAVGVLAPGSNPAPVVLYHFSGVEATVYPNNHGVSPPALLGPVVQSTVGAASSDRRVLAVDIDADLRLDIVTLTSVGIHWFKSVGDGTLATASVVHTGSMQGFDCADVTGSGSVDVVAFGSAGVFVYENADGLGTMWVVHVASTTSAAGAYSALVADVDGDGLSDIIVPGGPRTVWFQTAPLVFAPATMSYSGFAFRVAVADLDADSDLDVVVGFAGPNVVRYVLQTSVSSRTFDAAVDIALATSNTYELLAHDFNGDSFPDLAWAQTGGVFMIALHTGVPGAPTFTLTDYGTGGFSFRGLALDDFDGDGFVDAAATDHTGKQLVTFKGLGAGVFASLDTTDGAWGISTATGIATADLNGDGAPDVVGGSASELGLRINVGRSPFTPVDVSDLTMVYTSKSCASAPMSMACLVDNIGRLSRCAKQTLIVAPGTYAGCLHIRPLDVTHDIALTAAIPGSVVFDCASVSGGLGGTLFSVRSGASLTLTGLVLRNMGVGTASFTATSGLRVEGAGSVLTLRNVRIEDARTGVVSGITHARPGVGGAVVVANGGLLVAEATNFTRCIAADSGGAVAVFDAASTAVLTDVSISSSSAARYGGGVYASDGASVVATRARLVANTALNGGGIAIDGASLAATDSVVTGNSVAVGGLGGGVFVAAGFPSFRANLTRTVVSANTASIGGGLALASTVYTTTSAIARTIIDLPAGAASAAAHALPGAVHQVHLADAVLTGNTARTYGGGLFVCDAHVGVTGASSVWTDNVGSASGALASADDALLCGLAPGALGAFVPDRAAQRLPWLTLGASVPFAASAKIAGPVASLTLAATAVAGPSGTSLPGTLTVTEWLGQQASYANAMFSISYPDLPPGIVASTPVVQFNLVQPVVTLPFLPIYASDVSAVPATATATVSAVYQVDSLGISVAPGAAAWSVTACDVGSGGLPLTFILDELVSVTTCGACAIGTFSDEVSFAACAPVGECSGNTFNGGAANATRPVCMCKPGFYPVAYADAGVASCATCPEGAFCAGDLATPVPLSGFFATSNTTFVRCIRSAACPGGPTPCAPRYSGFMCNACTDGSYSTADGECAACPDGVVRGLLFTLVIVSLFSCGAGGAVGVVMIKSIARAAPRASDGMVRSRLVPGSLSMVLVAFQVVGLISGASFSWTKASQQALAVFNFANVDSSLFASECALSSFHIKYVVSMAVPVAILLVAGIFLLVARLFSATLSHVSYGLVLDGVLFMVAPLLYIPIARASLILFDCSKIPNGEWVLDADPGVACFDGAWWSVAPAGLAVALAFVLGVPLYMVDSLRRVRHTLGDAHVFLRYGSLYKLWRLPFYWFGVIDLVKRLLLVLAAVFASSQQLVQIGILLGVLVTSLVFVRSARPHYYPSYNTLDFRLSVIVIVILLLGFGSYAERSSGTGTDAFFNTAIYLVVVGLVLLSAVSIALDIREIMRERAAQHSTATGRARLLRAAIVREIPDLDPEVGAGLATWVGVVGPGLKHGSAATVAPFVPDSSNSSDSEGCDEKSTGVALTDFGAAVVAPRRAAAE